MPALNCYDADTLRKLAEAWVRSARRALAAEIDAEVCGTPRYHRITRELGDAESEARDALCPCPCPSDPRGGA